MEESEVRQSYRDGALPSRRLKLSQGGDARGIDFVIPSGSAALLRSLGALEPAGVAAWVLVGWTAGDPPY